MWRTVVELSLVVLLAAGLACGQAGSRDGEPRTQPARDAASTQPAGYPEMIPWVEASTRVDGSYERTLRGLLAWQPLVKRAIVSVGPDEGAMLLKLKRAVPGITIIPGIKTSALLAPGRAGFDSVRAWGQLAALSERLCDAMNVKVILFEHESALKKYQSGEYEMDLARLRAGLRQMPEDLLVLWYPSAYGGAQLEPSIELCQAVEDGIKDVVFVDTATVYSPHALASPAARRCKARLVETADKPPARMIYAGWEGMWPLKRVPEAIRATRESDMVILYPGAKRWVSSAWALGKIFEESGIPTRRDKAD